MGLGNIGPGLCYSAAGILPVICSIMVALRFYSRKTRGIHLGLDDWLVLPALLALIGMSVAILVGVALHGVAYSPSGPSGGSTPTKQLMMTRLILWIVYMLGPISLTLVKVSFVLWYRRLFWQASSKAYKIIIWTVLAVLIAWGVCFFMAFLFICPGHPAAYWGTTADVLQKCNTTTTIYQAYSTSDPILDIIVFILPMFPRWKLQMTTKKKLGVMCVFMLGAMTIIASILRMVLIWEATLAEYRPGTDIPPLLTSGMYWGLVEGGVALISCCLPTCASLIRNHDHTSKHSMTSDKARKYPSRCDEPFGQARHHSTFASFDEEVAASPKIPDTIIVTKSFSALAMDARWDSQSQTESGSTYE